MKSWDTLQGSQQTEALLNEIKGNLFEYLVGQKLSQAMGNEIQFLKDFEKQDFGKAKEELLNYQGWLIEHDRELYSQLPELSSQVSRVLLECPELKNARIRSIQVVGKRPNEMRDHEEDLLVELEKGKRIGISLKLCKKGAYVNTKSGGILSFIEKYFSAFDGAQQAQLRLNDVLEKSFKKLSYDFYDWADIDLEDNIDNRSQFSPQWEAQGLPNLPGELPEELKEKLFSHYHSVITQIFTELKSFYEKNPRAFLECLAPLVGLGRSDILQVTCFHESTEGKRYQLSHIKTFGGEEFQRAGEYLRFGELRKGISSFVLYLGNHQLQIRVKPMNKFTVCALKVNCSLKESL